MVMVEGFLKQEDVCMCVCMCIGIMKETHPLAKLEDKYN